MRVLIAGCGYIGTALGVELAAEGDQVAGLRRDPRGLPDAIHPVAADLLDRDTFTAIPRDLDAVVFTVSADARDPDAYRRAYVDGPENLLDWLADRGDPIERVLFTSSTAVYGQTDGSWVDEEAETEPETETGEILLEGEWTILSDTTGMVVRLGGIYGPGRTRLVEQVRRGDAVCPDQTSYTNRIHRDDCAGLLAHLLMTPRHPPIVLGVDDDPADRCTVYRWLAERLGVDPPRTGGPSGWRGANKRCRNTLMHDLGYRLRYPSFRDGYGALLGA